MANPNHPLGEPMTEQLSNRVRPLLEQAIRAQRESWDTALAITELTGYDGDIYAFVAETAGALEDDEAIPNDLVDELISPANRSRLRFRSDL